MSTMESDLFTDLAEDYTGAIQQYYKPKPLFSLVALLVCNSTRLVFHKYFVELSPKSSTKSSSVTPLLRFTK